ncbi:hypothetical protein D3C71_1802160 [compost metagenome]
MAEGDNWPIFRTPVLVIELYAVLGGDIAAGLGWVGGLSAGGLGIHGKISLGQGSPCGGSDGELMGSILARACIPEMFDTRRLCVVLSL